MKRNNIPLVSLHIYVLILIESVIPHGHLTSWGNRTKDCFVKDFNKVSYEYVFYIDALEFKMYSLCCKSECWILLLI